MKKLSNVLIFLGCLATSCYTIIYFNQGAYDRLLGSISLIFVLFIPKIINKLFKVKIKDAMELVYVVFILLAQFIGSVVDLYNHVWWYDLFTHFLSGILTTIFALVVMDWFKIYNPKKKGFNILFMLSFTLMIASIWEFIEFGSYITLGMDVQHHLTTGVFDTMEDMLIAFLGSIIVIVSYLIEDKVTKNGFLKKIVSDLK